jgi:RNA polymerase sigma-70 factor (ECF subfamily)
MPRPEPDTDVLLAEVSQGNASARSQLLDRHRDRLRQMIAVRLDRRVAARVDPSDVVQEILLEADRQLADYLETRPLPFYPWLRQIAGNKLMDLYRRHISAQRRSVSREDLSLARLPDDSAWQLAERLFAPGSGPLEQVVREEMRRQVREALDRLAERDREVLVLRHLERLTTAEIAEVLGISEPAVHTRHLRALQRLGTLLKKHLKGEQP